jgi:hypothetical protein
MHGACRAGELVARAAAASRRERMSGGLHTAALPARTAAAAMSRRF